MINSHYDPVPHGKKNFRMAVFSETIYEIAVHHHDEYCIYYLAEGKMDFTIAGSTYKLKAGDAVFVEPYTIYGALANKNQDSFHYYAIVFGEELLGNENDPCRLFLKQCKMNRFIRLNERIIEDLPTLREVTIKGEFGFEMLMKSSLLNIFAHLVNTGQYTKLSDINKSTSDNVSNAIIIALQYIEAHYKEAITLSDIMKYISYSKSHFMRLFKAHTGMSFTEYINNYRVEKACLELIYTQHSATDIAVDCGFSSVQYFTKIFRKITGHTPMAFRKLSYWFGHCTGDTT